MTRRHLVFLTILVVLATCSTSPGYAARRWKLLGKQSVNKLIDHDTVSVGSQRGTFRRLKLRVRKVAVNFHRVVVHYARGADEALDIRQQIPAGGETRAIDLRGGDRVIRSVDFWYDSKGLLGREAIVELYGRD